MFKKLFLTLLILCLICSCNTKSKNKIIEDNSLLFANLICENLLVSEDNLNNIFDKISEKAHEENSTGIYTYSLSEIWPEKYDEISNSFKELLSDDQIDELCNTTLMSNYFMDTSYECAFESITENKSFINSSVLFTSEYGNVRIIISFTNEDKPKIVSWKLSN